MTGRVPEGDGADAELHGLCRELWPRLVGTTGLLVGRVAAEEVAQEALVRLWLHWATVRTYERPDGWVFRVAYNLSVSHLRRRAIERRALALMPFVRPAVMDSAGADGDADRLELDAALSTLSTRQRAAVVLRFYADLSVAETATAMRCAPGTVTALTHQAMSRLREQLGDLEEEEGPDR